MIWCVDDDEAIRDIEVYSLNATGFDARGFADGTELFDALKSDKPQLILLDIMLPGEDGVELLKRLRGNIAYQNIPVIMATAKGAEIDKVVSLDIGADDYLVKPFGMMEMVSRVKAVLRRCQSVKEQQQLCHSEIVLNVQEHIVTVEGKRIALTFKEFELLRLFMSHPGIVFSREQLFSDVWGMDYCGETRTVDMHIRTLRQKLGSYGNLIETVINVGYRMEVST